MTLSLVIEVLRSAARIIAAASSSATAGEWWADSEVVHAPHWHPDKQGDVCYPLIAQNGSDPDADAKWAALLSPRRGPKLVEALNVAADDVECTGQVDAITTVLVQLAVDITGTTARAAEMI